MKTGIPTHWRTPSTAWACLLAGLMLGSCGSSRTAMPGSTAPSTPATPRGETELAPAALAPAQPPEPADREPSGEEDVQNEEAAESPEDAGSALPEEVLAAALEEYESAGAFWDEGHLENALAALERAFGLLLGVPEGGEALVEQQREDLRRLIALRIVDIYASRQTAAGENGRSLPLLAGDEVEREIRSFQNGERDFFLASYRRSGLYHPMILEKVRAAGLPEQLSWLPLIESGFKTRARSRAAAVGLWQFIASTGYRFGLSRDRWIDERMDPEKSTDAAIAYLTELHGLYGDWATALAAYNCGEGRVSRLIRSQRFDYLDHFWDLYQQLPPETRRYVPRFFAALRIIEQPGRYGLDLEPPPAPPGVATLQIDRSLALSDVDRRLGLAAGTTAALNPELRNDVTPPTAYALRVPADPGRAADAVALLLRGLEAPRQAAPAASLRRVAEHRVRPGETLSGIAERYGTTAASLKRLNRLPNSNRIYPGQRLNITRGGTTVHTVRRGDTLWDLARRYGTKVSSIMRENGLDGRSARRLRTGQRLRIPQSG